MDVLETCSSLSLLLTAGDRQLWTPDCLFNDFWLCVRAAIFDATKSVSETFLSEDVGKVGDEADTGGDTLNLLPHECIKLGDCAWPCDCEEASPAALDVGTAELSGKHYPGFSLEPFSTLSSSSSPESPWSGCFSPCSSPFSKPFTRPHVSSWIADSWSNHWHTVQVWPADWLRFGASPMKGTCCGDNDPPWQPWFLWVCSVFFSWVHHQTDHFILSLLLNSPFW